MPILGLLLALGTSQAPPSKYPLFDISLSNPIILTTFASNGEYFPQFEACEKPQAFCMDPPPFWFNADRIHALYGNAPARLKISTTSHYGLEQAFNDDKGLRRIMLVLEHQGEYVMPRYAAEVVYSDRAGREYMLLTRRNPTWWLPCSVYDLKEPIAQKNFGRSSWTAKIVNAYYKDDLSLFEISGKYAFPKFGIPLDRLSAHLREIRPSVSQITCGREI